jgi:hypothetical protein
VGVGLGAGVFVAVGIGVGVSVGGTGVAVGGTGVSVGKMGSGSGSGVSSTWTSTSASSSAIGSGSGVSVGDTGVSVGSGVCVCVGTGVAVKKSARAFEPAEELRMLLRPRLEDTGVLVTLVTARPSDGESRSSIAKVARPKTAATRSPSVRPLRTRSLGQPRVLTHVHALRTHPPCDEP